jgi:hypothetical protein
MIVTVVGIHQRTMGADAVPEIEALDDLARADINHYQLSSISAGIAHARISVDRNVS